MRFFTKKTFFSLNHLQSTIGVRLTGGGQTEMIDSKGAFILMNIEDRRLGLDRRQFSYSSHIPERRCGMDRRSDIDRRNDLDRRNDKDRRNGIGAEAA